ncbi:transferrin-binding protein-like solute binding protein [Gallibacterium sp. AGMB14963]|uniref:transferrin-binding protein-like solute binding protein n=1 Tax=Gallibacterium faecale TaxID=3019086 RepID=UPI0022F189C8|nr:transferrin-binding protein-like solute binding protein [Gallibacterium sp. AGMB14963]MDA3979194.1 transferrin-binding protein-like solute binding protein [Gallibacterium sp. AGMB14963]
MDTTSPDIELNVDFNKKTIKGQIGYDYYYMFNKGSTLEEGIIKAEGERIVFNGKITEASSPSITGEYNGIFMGKDAHQLAGEIINIDNSKSVFVAEKETN